MSKIVMMEKEVAALGDLSREELAERWKKTYGHPPPKGARRDFLLRAAAWREQPNRLGGLPPDTRRTIADVAKETRIHLADVSRILPLAFLAPKIPDAILRGRQPVELTARALMRNELPVLWTNQLQQFGI